MRPLLPVVGLTLLLVFALGASAAARAEPPAQPPRAAQTAQPAQSKQAPGLSGRVLDAASMQPIAGAVVQSGEMRAVTDAAGRFALAPPPGETKVSVSAEGYIPDEVKVTIGAAPVAIEVVLFSTAQFKEEVTVSGATVPAAPSPATIELSPLQVRTVAGAGENVFKVLQTLPGVNATADYDSRLSVRGGGPDQNLTIMDGIEIHDPYRLFGLASAFNPETVQNFELTAGGFSPKYGDRLSSILVIDNRPGTKARRLRGTATVALTDANVVAEGRMPGQVDGSWIVSARRTYYDLIADKIVGTHLPSFGDVQAKGVWELRPGLSLTMFVLTSRENTDAAFTESSTSSRVGLTDAAGNDLVSASFVAALGRRASSRTIVSWYRYTDALGAAGDFRNESARSNWPDDTGFGRTALEFTYKTGVRDVSVREEAGIKASDRHVLEAGFETHSLRTSAAWELISGRNTSEANGSSARGGTGLPSKLDSNVDSTRAGAWLVDRFQAAKWLTIEPGLRVDWSSISRETIVSPRVSANIAVRPNLRVRAATGLFTQSPGYEKLLQADYFVDLTSATRLSIKSERAVHVLGAVERDMGHGLLARVEGYYKMYDRLLIGRLETPEETAARVALYGYPPELRSSVPTAPQVTSTPTNNGAGTSFGFDVYVAHRATSAADRFVGWASYAWGRADTEAYGRRYPFDYDRRHALSMVGTMRLTRTLDLGATVRVASGFPYTPVQGLRVAAQEVKDESGNVIRYVPQYDQNGLLVWTTDSGNVGDLNSGRLPVFARVDMRVTFRPARWHNAVQFYLEVINALNRKNTGTYQTKLEYDPTSDRPTITQSSAGSLPLIPSFGCRIVF
ncbi:MAG TPA: TonB-dependent receptor [Vicinamibacterales bacterium]